MRISQSLLSTCCVLGTLFVAHAQQPIVSRVTPLAVTPGKQTRLVIAGQNLSGADELWTSFNSRSRRVEPDGETGDTSGPNTVMFDVDVPDSVGPGIGVIRVAGPGGVSNWHLLGLDAFATKQASGTNDHALRADSLPVPGALEARMGELKSHFIRVSGTRGQRFAVDVLAHRIGSPMDPVLRLFDASGKEMISAEDTPGLGADVALEWKFPRTGEYRLEVRDTLHRGGESFRYRLRASKGRIPDGEFQVGALPRLPGERAPLAIREMEPNNDGPQAQQIEPGSRIFARFNKPGDRDVFQFRARKNQRLLFAGKTRSLGSACDLFLQLMTTNGSPIAEANIAGANEGTLTNTFKEAGTYHLVVEEINRGGAGQPYQIDCEELGPGFALSVALDTFTIQPGGKVEVPVTIDRRNFDGPITLEIQGWPQGFTATNNVFRGKEKELKIHLVAPADASPEQWFFCTIRGHGTNEGQQVSALVKTFPALRELWPRLLYPPEALNGWLALGIAPPTEKR